MHNHVNMERQASIDWQLSIKLANNNTDLAKELLSMFVSDLPRASEAIHQAFNTQNYNELIHQVHRLHGASCYCGVSRLRSLLAKMEFSVREKFYDQFEAKLKEFDEEVNNILAAYKVADYT